MNELNVNELVAVAKEVTKRDYEYYRGEGVGLFISHDEGHGHTGTLHPWNPAFDGDENQRDQMLSVIEWIINEMEIYQGEFSWIMPVALGRMALFVQCKDVRKLQRLVLELIEFRTGSDRSVRLGYLGNANVAGSDPDTL